MKWMRSHAELFGDFNGLGAGCDFQQQVGGRLLDRVASGAGVGRGFGHPTHSVDCQMTHPASTVLTFSLLPAEG